MGLMYCMEKEGCDIDQQALELVTGDINILEIERPQKSIELVTRTDLQIPFL